MIRVFKGPAGCSTVTTPGQEAHATFHHIVSLQQNAMDTLEATLSDSHGTVTDNNIEVDLGK